MTYELIQVEKKDRVTLLTINRPEVMNAISPPTTVEMDRAISEYRDDPEQWVCIITGAGEKAFSAGNDLKYTAKHGMGELMEVMQNVKSGFAGITTRDDLFKPVIAAVNGLAMGGGFEIALASDIVIASDNATFSFPEPRVGLMADAGGVHRLPRQIPYHVAMDLLLTSRRITAAEALSYGLISRVVPQADMMAEAEKVASEIMQGAPLSIQATKQSAVKGLEMPLQEALMQRQPKVLEMYGSSDLIEGPRAFAEKRKPEWKGK